MEGEMRHKLDVNEEQIREGWRQALGIPENVWAHDERTKTIGDLCEEWDIGDQAARERVADALEKGLLVEGYVRGERGHFLQAYRLVDEVAV